MARGWSTYHHDDIGDSDQEVANKELSLSRGVCFKHCPHVLPTQAKAESQESRVES